MTYYGSWKAGYFRHFFNAGAILAYPTESVYGLGCDPNNSYALSTLWQLKNRSPEKGFILIAANFEQLAPFVGEISDQIKKNIQQPSVRPITWLVPANKETTSLIRGSHEKLAIRITHHKSTAELCSHINSALISTSANPAGATAAKTFLQVRRYFNKKIDLWIPGKLGAFSRPSRIIDAETMKIIRH